MFNRWESYRLRFSTWNVEEALHSTQDTANRDSRKNDWKHIKLLVFVNKSTAKMYYKWFSRHSSFLLWVIKINKTPHCGAGNEHHWTLHPHSSKISKGIFFFFLGVVPKSFIPLGLRHGDCKVMLLPLLCLSVIWQNDDQVLHVKQKYCLQLE